VVASLSSSSRSCCKRSCSSFHALMDPARTVGSNDTDSSRSGLSGGGGVFCCLHARPYVQYSTVTQIQHRKSPPKTPIPNPSPPKMYMGATLQSITSFSTDETKSNTTAPYRLWAVMRPDSYVDFENIYKNCLFVCLLNFLTYFPPSLLSSLYFFLTYLLFSSFTSWQIYSLQNRPIPGQKS